MAENGVWRTVGGRRIFIKDGQSLSDAMKKSGKFNLKKTPKVSNADAVNYMQDQFKAFDQGKISSADLEKAKKDSGLSKEEIEKARNYVNDRATENNERQTENKSGNTTSQPVPKRELDDNNYHLDPELRKKDYENDLKWFEDMSKRYGTSLENNEDYKALKADYEAEFGKGKSADNEDVISKKQFDKAAKIDDKLERAVQMQVADDVGKELDDDDIRFRAENYVRHNYNGSATDDEIYERLKSAYKNNGTYKEKEKATPKRELDDNNYHLDPELRKKDYENDLKWFEDMEKRYPSKGGLAANEDYQSLKKAYESEFGKGKSAERDTNQTLTQRYKGTYDYLKSTTNMSNAEILEILKKMEKDNKK